MKSMVYLIVFLFLGGSLLFSQEKTYVGEDVCGSCHPDELESFNTHAKKAHSFEKIQILRPTLTEREYLECLECHTTGFGKPGGFVDEETTPHLKNPGCEVCHGPGSLHMETMSKDDITTIDTDGCAECHNNERVRAFKYVPVRYGGAH